MQRIERRRPPSIFRSSELPRLLSMVAMLGLLLLLIGWARDPHSWTWLVGDAASGRSAQSPPAQAAPARPRSPQAGPEKQPAPEKEKLAPTGPTDQDREEREAIEEEFQAISDGTLSIRPEEMPAYRRLWRWVRSQPLPLLHRRARSNLTFNDLYQTPERYRGQLVSLELHVRRILQDELDGIPRYEVWGFTTASKPWPYVAAVMDLPEGMPVGGSVEEEATVVGYFFKLQGYHPADAKPNAPPLRAPLLVGRLLWHPDRVSSAEGTDWTWVFVLLLGFLVLVIARWGLVFLRERRRTVLPQPSGAAALSRASLDDWLAEPELSEAADEVDEEDKATEGSLAADDDRAKVPSNGRNPGSSLPFGDGPAADRLDDDRPQEA